MFLTASDQPFFALGSCKNPEPLVLVIDGLKGFGYVAVRVCLNDNLVQVLVSLVVEIRSGGIALDLQLGFKGRNHTVPVDQSPIGLDNKGLQQAPCLKDIVNHIQVQGIHHCAMLGIDGDQHVMLQIAQGLPGGGPADLQVIA